MTGAEVIRETMKQMEEFPLRSVTVFEAPTMNLRWFQVMDGKGIKGLPVLQQLWTTGEWRNVPTMYDYEPLSEH